MKKQNIIMIVIIAIIAVVVIGVGVKLHQGGSSDNQPSVGSEQQVELSVDEIEDVTVDDENINAEDANAEGTEGTTDDAQSQETDQTQSNSGDSNGGDSSSNTGNSNTGSSDTGSSDTGNEAAPPVSEPEDTMTCTVTIRCDTILDNMANLTPGKEGLVPSSGYLLGKTTIEFEEGDTAFDVTKEACANAGLQIEYSYTPAYGSYYVEGINNLYEFDCGPDSGWMYKVNGWFPNYGSSSYAVEDGDNIVWCYTCNGLGADVGASGY